HQCSPEESLWPSYLVKSLASMFSRRAPLAILFGESLASMFSRRAPLAILFGEKSSINVLQKSPSGHPIW
ncbi:hypothetical protein BgiBS90_008091, partial [Biomphalaria glabrata]